MSDGDNSRLAVLETRVDAIDRAQATINQKVDDMRKEVSVSNQNYWEWKGRAQLMLYIVPLLTGAIGFLVGMRV